MTIKQEFNKLHKRLRDNDEVFVLIARSTNTMKLNMMVHADKNSQRSTTFPINGDEVYKKPNDEDRRTCLSVLETALDGLHLKPSKYYYRKGSSEYYVKPDWGYWNRRRGRIDDGN